MSSVNSCACHAETYLTAEQVGYFRARLHDWRHELCARMKGASGETMNEGVPDWIDAASINSQVAASMAEQERCRQLIRQIDAALGRIAEGSYGYCLETGVEIGIKRLLVLPTAQYSVDAQNDIEQRSRRLR